MSDGSQTQDPRRPSARTIDSNSSLRHQLHAIESHGTGKHRKPYPLRRMASSSQTPHKGQEFSADDLSSEVDEDLAHRAKTVSGHGSLRKQPSSLCRRSTALVSNLAKVTDAPRAEDDGDATQEVAAGAPTDAEDHAPSSEEDEEIHSPDTGEEEEEADLSDAESFTLKDRQEAINETHPFGIRIWKPALYKKNRSVQKTAEGDIHSSPGGRAGHWIWLFNIFWTLAFGWWLAIVSAFGAAVCFVFGFSHSGFEYGRVLWGLAGYLFWPFGKFVKLHQDEAYADEDEGEGRSISEYEQWQSGDLEHGRLFFGPSASRSLVGRRRNSIESSSETDSLLGRSRTARLNERQGSKGKRRLFGRGQWNIGRIIFFIFFYGLITPLLLLVSAACWLLVFWIPMGRVTLLLFRHLRRHPLALSFHSDHTYSRTPGDASSVLLCTYRAAGLKYWKYTVDGTNIFFINLIAVVLFVIFDYWVFDVALGLDIFLTHSAFVFILALLSIIPLAYFIGQAVASISAQSSMGVGAAINAFFSTIVEVFLYCVALRQGKAQLVEGSIIGSIFAGILFLPGLSMCFGAIKRKTQRFNVRSAGVTSTMLLFAVIAAFGPTLFYQIYGTHQLNCRSCVDSDPSTQIKDCRRCFFSQVPAKKDRFFVEAVRPYCWFSAVCLFLSYVIGLLFTLRTHAAVIWSTDADEKKLEQSGSQEQGDSQHDYRAAAVNGTPKLQPGQSYIGSTPRSAIKDSQLYKRILGQSLKQAGLSPLNQPMEESVMSSASMSAADSLHMPPPKMSEDDTQMGDAPPSHGAATVRFRGLSDEENQNFVRQVAEMAATAATVAARDVVRNPRRVSGIAHSTPSKHERPTPSRAGTFQEEHPEAAVVEGTAVTGGHDAPNWSRTKSSVILLGATVLYAIIAEILVDTVDVVLESVEIDEKFLGITLFALVPNTTEFLNAISFAMNGNIALSMEIGSAYALQVCLLQIPALVLFSAVHEQFLSPHDVVSHTFSLIFPQWDMVTVILCVFLLSYMYGEGKSNYFKGSILILSYLVVTIGFYFSGMTDMDIMGVNRFDTLALGTSPFPMSTLETETFKTIGRGRSGLAY
ncbi:calcium/ hydrogen exchanger [Xylona heveae TC161]|uniref:Calcium/ hydrogen exchanger n=1 Tax=Xylona heveae (strain CBS 132557 / TC161) TaxID=1328760 RepID=A0A165GWZ1_XYLHT|nr:calcium/ hydrogen exchanger [Xylona heveae TC161]KZF22706.1 calcium/ hydrogen exchanger [Xylona heveae TC161]